MALSATNGLQALSQSMIDTVEKVRSSLVYVHGRRNVPVSGFVYTDETIITTSHVLNGGKEHLLTLPNGESITARFAGHAPEHDLALLRLTGLTLHPVNYSTDSPRVGQLVVAIGKPDPTGMQATLGILSRITGPLRLANGAILEQSYLTDAVHFPGFSGGPLVDIYSKVVGINTTYYGGKNFTTIPIHIALQIAKSLEQYGRIRRGYIGIRTQRVRLYASHRKELRRSQIHGLAIIQIEPDSPGARADLTIGDVITGINGDIVQHHSDLLIHLNSLSINQTLSVEILRGSQRSLVHVPVREHR
jgi:S1-C subfamily serine protease